MYYLFTNPGCLFLYQDQDNVLSESHNLDFNGRNIFFREQFFPSYSLSVSQKPIKLHHFYLFDLKTEGDNHKMI